MKTIIYMAMTLNGYIAKSNDKTNWSKEEWKSYSNIVKNVGNLIVGRRTYDIMIKNKEFDRIKPKFIVVLSRTKFKVNLSNVTIVDSPKKAIKFLNGQYFKEALICGGSIINSLFMKERLVDEIILDIEPIIYGKGIKLFNDLNFECNLELLNIFKLSSNLIQVHYKIKK